MRSSLAVALSANQNVIVYGAPSCDTLAFRRACTQRQTQKKEPKQNWLWVGGDGRLVRSRLDGVIKSSPMNYLAHVAPLPSSPNEMWSLPVETEAKRHDRGPKMALRDDERTCQTTYWHTEKNGRRRWRLHWNPITLNSPSTSCRLTCISCHGFKVSIK